ncbi:MAG TPA: 1,4-alpha-glucan branching protein GlgB [Actinomycetota bacterium]|nr:1,4-alpha-glucan branching protein GlgB [Actinomycetota bacterium]
MTKDRAALVRGELRDPHALLGVHPEGEGSVVRVWRPEAQSVSVIIGDEIAAKLDIVDVPGLFEGHVDEPVERYELEVTYPEGNTFRLHDPYAFLPTLGDLDLHLVGEGRHLRLHDKLGAHVRTERDVPGTSFAVWAPNARSVRVVGDFNTWDGRLHPMRSMGDSGIWELFIPDVGAGSLYKFEVLGADGNIMLKTDPFGFQTEIPPANACVVHEPGHDWSDREWMSRREDTDHLGGPMSIYEVHLGSWRRTPENETLSYRDAARQLADYCRELGFTHVEFLPLAEHPFAGSWGYQVSNYFAPTSRFGDPDEFRLLVDTLHAEGIGVIVDWVPAHFPKDEWALARFDGTALFEHLDPKKGEHPDWGTYIFNFGRNEVRNFLISNALYWIEEFHIDGLRVDAVASMLYLDYSRAEGQWIPNAFGGRENIEAIEFLKELNAVVHAEHPGILMIAEESTSWPGVSHPVDAGGLGFGMKWNMGWMHDTLDYFQKEPIYRKYHHNQLTFSLWYAFSENFVLPFSHDEVVHGKGSLIGKMPGDRWQAFANLRALYAYMWAHPGKKLVFMGDEFAQSREWNHDRSLDWHLLDFDEHQGIQRFVADINKIYQGVSALWEVDFSPEGFRWIEPSDADSNVLAFLRTSRDGTDRLVCICNFAPTVRQGYRIGLPVSGTYEEILNSDAELYGGGDVGNMGAVVAEEVPMHGFDHSAAMTLPPLAVVWLRSADRT